MFFFQGERNSPSTVTSPWGKPCSLVALFARSLGIHPLFTSTVLPSFRSKGVTTRKPSFPSNMRGPISISWSCRKWPVEYIRRNSNSGTASGSMTGGRGKGGRTNRSSYFAMSFVFQSNRWTCQQPNPNAVIGIRAS